MRRDRHPGTAAPPGYVPTVEVRFGPAPDVPARRVTCREEQVRVDFAVACELLGLPRADGLRDLYDAVRPDGPPVMRIDDAHWCDDGTLRWISYLLRRRVDRPLRFVMTMAAGRRPVSRAAYAEILGSDRCRVVEPDPPLDDDPAAVLARVRDLGRDRPYLPRVARAAAILRTADRRLVGALAEVPPRLAGTALAALARVGALRPDADPPVPEGVARLLFGGEPARDLVPLRERAARLLNDAGRPVDVIAAQLILVPAMAEAWMPDVLREAASTATRPADAIRYWRRLENAQPNRAEAKLALAEAIGRADAASAMAHLRSLLEHPADARTMARIAAQIARGVLAGVPEPTMPGLLGQALENVRAEVGPRPGLADRELCALLESMDAAISIGSVAAAREATQARAGSSPALGAGTAAGRYELAGYALAGALAGAGATTATAHALCVLRSGETEEPWPALAAARVLFLGDENGEALTGLRTLVDRCEQRQEAWGECQVRAARAVMLLRIGEVDEAGRDADRAGHLATHRLSGPALLARAHTAQAAVLLAQSQVARARVMLDAVETRWIEDDVWEYPEFLIARAAADTAHGDADAGLVRLRRCGEVLTTAGVRNPLLAPWWVDAILALGPLGRAGEAAALAEEYDELCQRWNTPRSLGMALLARGAAATGRTRLHLLGAGAEALRAGPVSAYLIRLLLLFGRSLYERGDKAGARANLRDALGLAARHGFTTLATLARDELRMAGGRAGSGTDVGALTASERAVAELAAGGATNRQIAERLFVTVRTVEFHLTNVYRRFGIRHRAQLPDVLKAPATPTDRADR